MLPKKGLYKFGEIEKKWQDYWQKNKVFNVSAEMTEISNRLQDYERQKEAERSNLQSRRL